MGEIRCVLEWRDLERPRIVIDGLVGLTEAQVAELCYVLGETAVRKVTCMLECGETGCKKEEGHYGHQLSGRPGQLPPGSRGGQVQH